MGKKMTLRFNSKYIICLLILTYISSSKTFGKDEFEFAKITPAILEEITYPIDTSAVALVMKEVAKCSYDYRVNDFQVITKIKKRIKILKKEGTRYATLKIPFFSKRGEKNEKILRIKAWSYNLENKKVVKKKLDKDYIFNEKVNENYSQIKMAIPNAKVGTIIEYEYTRISPFYSELPTWFFQTEIPILHSSLTISIPEYFDFNIGIIGTVRINHKESSKTDQLIIEKRRNSEQISYRSRVIHFQADSIPSLKDAHHIWYVGDYLARVEFELKGIKFPNQPYKSYSQTWEDIERFIKRQTNLVRYTKVNTPYKEELAPILSATKSKDEKIKEIYKFIKNKIKWNNSYRFSSNPKEAIKKGTGDNAQINNILLSLFNKNNIYAYPVLLSRRSRGRLPFTFPSYDRLNTFVVAAEGDNGKTYYLDGSAYYGGLNMLPVDLLSDRARTFKHDQPNDWVNLIRISKNTISYYIVSEISPELELKGEMKSFYTNQKAYSYKELLNKLTDTTEYIEAFETNFDVKVKELEIDGHKDLLAQTVKESIKFTKDLTINGDFIYINPILFPFVKENIFKESERKLPIELDTPYSYSITSIISLPEGYTVEELPKPAIVKLGDGKDYFKYLIKKQGNKIIVKYIVDIENVIYAADFYKILQEFWGAITKKSAEVIVLKKQE